MAKAPSGGPRTSRPSRPRKPGRTPEAPATPARGDGRVPLERALSKLGLASRAEARRLILAGRATVDGAAAGDPDALVVPERIEVAIDGRLAGPLPALTVLLHKPRGVVTTRADPRGRPTVYSFLGGIDRHLGPVGRLDAATSGLLLLTSDTRFGDWVTDPANGVPRVYVVAVRGEVSDEEAARLVHGVEEGEERLTARAAAVRKRSRRESHLTIELTEGKNREVRRMLAAIGHPVTRLKRVAFGGLELGRLAPGEHRAVPAAELAAAFPGAPLRRSKAR
jgi:23S rRNA pseudouridine2605 synthase